MSAVTMDYNGTQVQDYSWTEWGFLRNFGELSTSRYVKLAALLLAWFVAISLFQPKRPRIANAPVHGLRVFWEPAFLLKFRFISNAYNIIGSGYAKYKDTPFVLRRLDNDINVLPMRYLDELRLVPRKDLFGKIVHYNTLFRSWPWASAIRDSDLHVHVLNKKLNPDLPRYVEMAHEELEYGWGKDVPQPSEWTKIDIQHVMRLLVARMSARVFVGNPTCRDPTWLDVTLNFSIDLFLAGFTLRMFPTWTYFFVKPLIPARWRVQRQIGVGTQVVRRLVQKREEEIKAGGSEDEGTLFDWMVRNARESEGTLEQMAARQCIITLASIHTTAETVANALYDIIAHPEWIDVLREEIDDIVKEHGELGQNMPAKMWLQRLEKMDSFIVESQRINPLILLTPQRIATAPLTLKDGTFIPQGTHIAWAGAHHAMDKAISTEQDTFDPLRSYNKRHSGSGENVKKFMAGQTDPDNMSFGYGNQVCPGRYFAVCEIKLLLMRLLREFDFAPSNGNQRPKTIHADEFLTLDHQARVMMKKREVSG